MPAFPCKRPCRLGKLHLWQTDQLTVRLMKPVVLQVQTYFNKPNYKLNKEEGAASW
uniref:Uncharacterized protein n=1 Tax=Acanthochromis polyacanthus TaxID=80966 RepID=A0A3Q1F3D1_9TELE